MAGRRPGSRVTATASAAPIAASVSEPDTPSDVSISAPPTAAPMAEAPKAIVDNHVFHCVVGASDRAAYLASVRRVLGGPEVVRGQISGFGVDSYLLGLRTAVTAVRGEQA